MTRATGGRACGATSTRSRFFPYAYSSASFVGLIPTWAPSSSISLTSETRIRSLTRVCGSGAGSGRTNRRGLKDSSPSSSRPPFETTKPLQAAASRRSSASRFNPLEAGGPGGEEQVRPYLQASHVSTQFSHQFVETSSRLIPTTLAHGERGLGFTIPVDDHVRDLLDLGVPDALPDRLVRLIHLDAEAIQLRRERPRRLAMRLADGDDPHLHGREPEREGASVVLGKDAHEALKRPEQRAMDDDRMMLLVVHAHVGEAEPHRHLVIELDRSHLPAAAEGVGHVEVDLWTVERSLPGTHDVLQRVSPERLLECGLGMVPLLVRSQPLL